MDAAASPRLTPLEARVLRIVWDTEPTTVRKVLDALHDAGDRHRAYTTVMTICSRLADKSVLDRRRQGKTDIYWSLIDRTAYERERARTAVHALVEEVGDVALVEFARQLNQMDDARRAKLERLAGGG